MPVLMDSQDGQRRVDAVPDALVEWRRNAHAIDRQSVGIADAGAVLVLKPAERCKDLRDRPVGVRDKRWRRPGLEAARLAQSAPEQPSEDVAPKPGPHRLVEPTGPADAFPDAGERRRRRQIEVLNTLDCGPALLRGPPRPLLVRERLLERVEPPARCLEVGSHGRQIGMHLTTIVASTGRRRTHEAGAVNGPRSRLPSSFEIFVPLF